VKEKGSRWDSGERKRTQQAGLPALLELPQLHCGFACGSVRLILRSYYFALLQLLCCGLGVKSCGLSLLEPDWERDGMTESLALERRGEVR
jgi:hypothetical protein